MAKKHSVKAHVQILDLTRAGSSISFEIFADKAKLGEIKLGQGSITWFRKNAKLGRKLTWTKFAELLNHELYGD